MRVGPNWPQGGEIDIAEGVNEYTSNQVTLHTTPGCTMPSTDPNALGITGSVTASADCETEATGNAGCGWRDTRSNSWGAPFNSNGGGVYTSELRPYLCRGGTLTHKRASAMG